MKSLNCEKNNIADIRIIFNTLSCINIDKMKTLFENKIGANKGFQIDFADTQVDVWFMLSDNIKGRDSIHIISSERRRLPKSVKKFYSDNDFKDNHIKFHYIRSPFEDYFDKVGDILSKISSKAKVLSENSETILREDNEIQNIESK